jgi:tetratricopeptide (TPR) repeat protein
MRSITRKALLTALLTVVAITGTAEAGWWDGVGDAEAIDLRDVIENPRKWKGKEIVFECYFHELTDFYNPYYTRFLPSHYVNFSVWPAGARLWNKEEYAKSFHFLFLEKDHKKFGHLVGTKKFAHLKIRGYVQNTFKNVPWIECRAIQVLEDGYTRSSLREVILGDRAADREQWDVALEHYARAAAASLPKEVLAGLEKKRGQAHEGLGDYAAAMAAYELARKYDLTDDEAKELLTAIAARMGRPAPTFDAPQQPGDVETAAQDDPMVEVRPVDDGRYPPQPMAMPAPVEAPAKTDEPVSTTPVEMKQPVEIEEPVAPARPTPSVAPFETAPPTPSPEPTDVTPVEKVEEPTKAPAPIRKKKTPKKRMSGPV